MGDLETVIYVILIVIFLISRLIRGAKKNQQRQQRSPETVPPPVEKQPESLFDTIRREIQGQQELEKSKQEAKQQIPAPQKKVVKKAPKKTVRVPMTVGDDMQFLDQIGEEGVSSFSEKMKKTFLPTEQEQRKSFEFDPREAFMMKTLLERRFEV